MINTLPSETLAYVFSFLTYDLRSLGRCEQVCRLWQQVIEAHAWKHVLQNHKRWPTVPPHTQHNSYKTTVLCFAGIKVHSNTLAEFPWQVIHCMAAHNTFLAVGGEVPGKSKSTRYGTFGANGVVIYDWENSISKSTIIVEQKVQDLLFTGKDRLVINLRLVIQIWNWRTPKALFRINPWEPELKSRTQAQFPICHMASLDEKLALAYHHYSVTTDPSPSIKTGTIPTNKKALWTTIPVAHEKTSIYINSLALGKNLLICGMHQYIRKLEEKASCIHRLQTWILDTQLQGFTSLGLHNSFIHSVVWGEDPALIISGDGQGVIHTWNNKTGSHIQKLRSSHLINNEESISNLILHRDILLVGLRIRGKNTQESEFGFEIRSVITGDHLGRLDLGTLAYNTQDFLYKIPMTSQGSVLFFSKQLEDTGSLKIQCFNFEEFIQQNSSSKNAASSSETPVKRRKTETFAPVRENLWQT